MKVTRLVMVLAMVVAVAVGMAIAQAPQGGAPAGGRGGPGAGGAPGGGQGRGGGGRGGPTLMITSPSFPDGGEVPMKFAGRGENKSPQFDFKWYTGMTPAEQPATVVTYALIFHDIENSTNRGTTDTLHWSVFNIPATAKGLPEGLGPGDLPDGTRNGPGINSGRGTPSYFGPGAGAGMRLNHYVFEFYALDTKLELPGVPTREALMAAMEGHVVGKGAYVGRFHTPAP